METFKREADFHSDAEKAHFMHWISWTPLLASLFSLGSRTLARLVVGAQAVWCLLFFISYGPILCLFWRCRYFPYFSQGVIKWFVCLWSPEQSSLPSAYSSVAGMCWCSLHYFWKESLTNYAVEFFVLAQQKPIKFNSWCSCIHQAHSL